MTIKEKGFIMKKSYSIRNTVMATGALFTMTLFASCLKTNDNNDPDTPVAWLMAFNLAPDKPSIGVALSGNNLTNTALNYINYTGGYLGIHPGTRSVEAYDAGTGASFTGSDFTFNEKNYYSLFVVGAGSEYRNVIVNDPLDSLTASAGKAYIRYINAIPDPGEPLITISDNNGSVINREAAFAFVSDFVEINAGTAAIAISNNNNIQASRTVALEERKVYTVLFAGIPGSEDTAKSVQIRYIENGTLSEDTAVQQGISVRQPRQSAIR